MTHFFYTLRHILILIESSVMDENKFILEENRALKKQLAGKKIVLDNQDRIALAKAGRKLGAKKLSEICSFVTPRSIYRWYQKLVAESHTYPTKKKRVGRPGLQKEIEMKIVEIAKDNRRWGYGKIVGAMDDLNHDVAINTVKKYLKKHGIPPIKDRKHESSWHDFITVNLDALFACDSFMVDVVDPFRMQVRTFIVYFFIHLGTRKVHIAGMTENPDSDCDWTPFLVPPPMLDSAG